MARGRSAATAGGVRKSIVVHNRAKMENFWYCPPRIFFFRVHDYENIWSENPHSSDYIELMYILDGNLTLVLSNGLRFTASAGDFLLTRSNEKHRDVFEPSRGLRVLLVQFEWEDAEEFFKLVDNRTLRDLDFATRAEAVRRINFMRDKWDSGELDPCRMSSQLHGLLTLFYVSAENAGNRASGPQKPTRSEMMRQVKFYLTQNYASPVTLEQLARHFEISQANLSRLFRREFGVGISRYLTTLRLESAVALLNDTVLPVSEVALRCGFSTSGYFIRIFRRYTGTTPKHYRLRKRQEAIPFDGLPRI